MQYINNGEDGCSAAAFRRDTVLVPSNRYSCSGANMCASSLQTLRTNKAIRFMTNVDRQLILLRNNELYTHVERLTYIDCDKWCLILVMHQRPDRAQLFT